MNLNQILTQFKDEVTSLTERLRMGLPVSEWRQSMIRLLARYHAAAMMAGLGTEILPGGALDLLEAHIARQRPFLDNFATVIRATGEFNPAWLVRAGMYANSAAASYWEGSVYRQAGRFLPLPAMPGDGTSQCLTNDRCEWRIETVDADRGDYDAKWVLDLNVTRHCQTCLERSERWNPLRIRNGEVSLAQQGTRL